MARKIEAGTVLEVQADCPEFPNDLKKWCSKQGKVLLSCNEAGGCFTAQVQL
jgi:TusA-related sulfurtransferase